MKNHWLKRIHIIFTQNRLSLILLALFTLLVGLYSYGLMWISPEYDEVLVSNAALNCPSNVFIEHVFWIKGQCVPIMLSSYIGGFMAFPYRVIFSLFGHNVFLFRLTNIVILLFSLSFLYLAVKEYFSKHVALLTLFFIGFDFQFFYNVRLERTMVIPFLLKCLFLYSASLYFHKQKTIFLLGSGFLMGLSIWTKFDAVFFYSAFLISWFLIKIRSIPRDVQTVKKAMVFMLGTTFGLLPLLYYLRYSLVRFLFIGKEVAGNSFIELFEIKAQNLFFQLFSYDTVNYIVRNGYSYSVIETLLSAFVVAIFVSASVYALKYKKVRFLVISTIIFYLFYFLYGGLKFSHHRSLIYPFPHLILAFYVANNRSWLTKLVPIVFAGIFIFSSVYFYYSIHFKSVTASFSKSIYSVEKYLSTLDGEILIGDWGITNQLLLIDEKPEKYTEIAFAASTRSVDQFNSDLITQIDRCRYIVLRKPTSAIFQNADRNLRSVIDAKLVYTDEIFQVYKCESN